MRKRKNPFDGIESPINPKEGLLLAKRMLASIPTPAVIGGGLAMMLYGSARATKDVDIYALETPPDETPSGPLSLGGSTYNKGGTPVDVLVIQGAKKRLYEHAIHNRVFINKYPVPTPEHLILIKYLAGRDKDMMDIRFLLKHKLVNVKKAAKLLSSIYPDEGGTLKVEEFTHDMAVEKVLLKMEKQK